MANMGSTGTVNISQAMMVAAVQALSLIHIFNNKLTAFIEMTACRDSSAESEINKAKEDFYTKYSYLKPECEKSRMEKIADGMKKACEWCKEHWKLIATIVIAVSYTHLREILLYRGQNDLRKTELFRVLCR